MQNKLIIDNGEKHWVSRSVTIEAFVLGYDDYNALYLLANKRGCKTSCPNMWNVPSGYLDYDETIEDCVVREVFEETNVKIRIDKTNLIEIDSTDSVHNQNVVFKYVIPARIHINDFELSNINSEDGEVIDIKWIPLSDVNEYKWAFKQKEFINNKLIL